MRHVPHVYTTLRCFFLLVPETRTKLSGQTYDTPGEKPVRRQTDTSGGMFFCWVRQRCVHVKPTLICDERRATAPTEAPARRISTHQSGVFAGFACWWGDIDQVIRSSEKLDKRSTQPRLYAPRVAFIYLLRVLRRPARRRSPRSTWRSCACDLEVAPPATLAPSRHRAAGTTARRSFRTVEVRRTVSRP